MNSIDDKEILVAEISGKRPGTKDQRKTERFQTRFDHVIISNNSEGYSSEWEIVNVPEDYRQWYIQNVKSSDNAWYAPMNRSYAIKYAREHGYKYLVQIDDNIQMLELSFAYEQCGLLRRYRVQKRNEMLDDYIEMFICVLQNTNAGMVGGQLAGTAKPDGQFIREGYCYSFFALDLAICPDRFQGDFEDDIEYKLKLAQMGIPTVQVAPLRYSKEGQVRNKDLTGCRAEYLKAGLKRGEHMKKLYGDIYDCEMKKRRNSVNVKCVDNEKVNFHHKIKPVKVGIVVYDNESIKSKMREIFIKNAEKKNDKSIIKEKKVKVKARK